jgi:peptidyl-tRNA hydrolase, PTH1 family
MLLFVGLGNPGEQYAGNRHNIGFMALEAIAKQHRFGVWKTGSLAMVSRGLISGQTVLLLKPQTFMNLSGDAVQAAAQFYKVGVGDIVVFHDELDLPPAKLRVKSGGGHGGHNGLRSISEHMGAEYRRVRLGIGHPGDKKLGAAYVLQNFAKDEWPWVETMCDVIADNAALLVEGKDSTFQNKVHLAMEAKGFGGDTADEK